VSLVLSLKPALHAIARRTTKDDVYATLKFLIVAVVLLPLLPDRTIGPLDVLNPFKLGLLIVFIAGVGFAATWRCGRSAGQGARHHGVRRRARLLHGGHARRLRTGAEGADLAPSCALAIVLANTVMAVRVLVVVAALMRISWRRSPVPSRPSPSSAGRELRVLAARPGGPRRRRELKVSNPFELSSAVKLGLLITAVLFATKFASVNMGTGGVYVASALAAPPTWTP